jgi:hypothetical protein
LDFFPRNKIPDTGSVDHILVVGDQLHSHLDAETRHVTLSRLGLPQALARVFVECVCALRGRDLNLPDGRRLRIPVELDAVVDILVDQVFAPKNEAYSDSFGDYGAVGVVIRLLDKVHDLKARDHKDHEPLSKSVAHVANYAAMAIILLVEDESGFLS